MRSIVAQILFAADGPTINITIGKNPPDIGEDSIMKAILLAGGFGTRLYPATQLSNKQLLPVYDKPMIYYPLSILMLAGIREILIISSPKHLTEFQALFRDGSHLGLDISYTTQPRPDGLAQAFILGKAFIGRDSVCLILGDNIFYGHGFYPILQECISLKKGGIIFGYQVTDPQRYGIVTFDDDRKVLSIEEKPANPESKYAIPGLYFYDNDVAAIAQDITPSPRGELEITAVNNAYLKRGDLKVKLLGRGFAWLDTGTHESLLEAANFIETIEKRQGLKIGCIEEVAFRKGYITAEQLETLAHPLQKTPYGQYLNNLIIEHKKGNPRTHHV